MKYLIAIVALLYTQCVIPEQLQTEWWQEGVLGAPCSLQSDFEDGQCLNFEVKRKPDWGK